MKKIISILLITISLNCFGQTSAKDSLSSKTLWGRTKADSALTMAVPAFSIDDLENFNKTLRKIMVVEDYEKVLPVLQYLNQLMWQRAGEIRKQKK